MLERSLRGGTRYWLWILLLFVLIGIGFVTYLYQLSTGLGVTGMSRDVSWGFYVAQFTFLVGVAASAVMLVLPYYLHHFKAFSRVIIFGEFLAVAAVTMCLLFIIVDLGQPQRALNVVLHPTPNSVLFWDMVVLNGYLLLNLIIGWTTLAYQHREVPPPDWVKPLIYISIIWAVSIHTVTAFLYAGLPGRAFWMTAIMAARFLASAFAAGPALLILLCLIMERVADYRFDRSAIFALAKIVTYAMILNVFFLLLEIFTAFYSGIPEHASSLRYLYLGLDGHDALVPFMWTSAFLAVAALVLLIVPSTRTNERVLPIALVALFISTWIDKGLGLVIAGFIPSMMEHVTEYGPTVPELFISLGVYSVGALVLTVLYKVALGVKKDVELQ